MEKAVRLFGVLSVAGLAGLIACTSTTVTTTDNGDAGTTTKDASTKHDSSTTPEEDANTGPDDSACKDEADESACVKCCSTNHTSGYATSIGLIIDCACKGTGSTEDAGTDDAGHALGPCGEVCGATLCAKTPKNPDSDCLDCINTAFDTSGACYAAYSDGCTGDCKTFDTCSGTCVKK